jgi:hypothetical protein
MEEAAKKVLVRERQKRLLEPFHFPGFVEPLKLRARALFSLVGSPPENEHA